MSISLYFYSLSSLSLSHLLPTIFSLSISLFLSIFLSPLTLPSSQTYFSRQHMVHDIFDEIEEHNFLLIQNQQDQEAALEHARKDLDDMRQANKAKIAEMESRLSYYTHEIEVEEQRIQQEESKIRSEREKSPISKTAGLTGGRGGGGGGSGGGGGEGEGGGGIGGGGGGRGGKSEEEAVEAAAVEAAVQGGLDRESAQAMGIVQLLGWIEAELLSLLRRAETMDAVRLKAELKQRNTARAKERKEKKAGQKEEELKRHKEEAQRRAEEPVHKKAGRQVSYRSAPKMRVKKNTQKQEEEVDEDMEFFMED